MFWLLDDLEMFLINSLALSMFESTSVKVLAIRMTQKEKNKIKDKVAKAGLSTNEFIIKCTNRAKLKAPLDLKPVVIELKKIGTNLNQIALKVNSGTVNKV